jgi:hypothetical protein
MTARIFISYARADAAVAGRIHEELTRLGLATWLDTADISPGESFVTKIDQGLSEASYVLSLLSGWSVRSEWVTREWSVAIARKTTVVPVLLDDVEVPALLSPLLYIDFRDRAAGLQRLREFFSTELNPLENDAVQVTPRGDLPADLLRSLSPREVRLVAVGCLSDNDLAAFLIDAELDPGDIEGNSLNQRILSLLHQVRRDGLATSFLEWLALERHRCFQRQLVRIRSGPRWEIRPDQD